MSAGRGFSDGPDRAKNGTRTSLYGSNSTSKKSEKDRKAVRPNGILPNNAIHNCLKYSGELDVNRKMKRIPLECTESKNKDPTPKTWESAQLIETPYDMLRYFG